MIANGGGRAAVATTKPDTWNGASTASLSAALFTDYYKCESCGSVNPNCADDGCTASSLTGKPVCEKCLPGFYLKDDNTCAQCGANTFGGSDAEAASMDAD